MYDGTATDRPRCAARWRAITLGVAALAGGLTLAAPAVPASALAPTPLAVYDAIGPTLAGNVTSLGFQARSMSAVGDVVQLAPGPRELTKVSVVMSSWACQAGGGQTCQTTGAATFSHPLTMTLYAVSGTPSAPVVGASITTLTQAVAVPYRPSWDPINCPSNDPGTGRWWDGTACFNGMAFAVDFAFPAGTILPDRLAWVISYNTQSYGAAPIGVAGPYNSLNVGITKVSPQALAGTDLDESGFLQASTWSGAYCAATNNPTSQLLWDASCWSAYRPMAAIVTKETSLTAVPTVVVEPVNLHGWVGLQENPSPGGLSGPVFVTGPATPPLGSGSMRLSVADATEGFAAVNSQFSGTKLADITALNYSTYSSTTPQTAALSFDITYPATANYGGRLVYEPYLTETVVPNMWQRWDALAGTWWSSKTDVNGSNGLCPQASPCTWTQVLTNWPNAVLDNPTPSPGYLVFKAGSGWTGGATVHVDDLVVGVDDGLGNITETTFDFENRCTTTCYVSATGNDANTGLSAGAALRTIQAAVDRVSAGGNVVVAAGTYDEDVTVTKAMTISGAGAAQSVVRGPIGGSVATFTVAAAGVTIDGFTITRLGNTVADWNGATNSQGVLVQAGNTEIRNSLLTENRTAIDLRNSTGSFIHDNVITNNRSGMLLWNTNQNVTVTRNSITNNWTLGVLFLASPRVYSTSGSVFINNDISGNWYAQIVDRQTDDAGDGPPTVLDAKNFAGNYLGTTTPTVTTAPSGEPGYTSQIPVQFGGTAVPPVAGSVTVAGVSSGNVDITPYLWTATDTAPATFGFTGSTASVGVTALGNQIGSTGRIHEGVAAVDAGGDVHVVAGDYPVTSPVSITKALRLLGPNSGVSPNDSVTPLTAATRSPEATITPTGATTAINVGSPNVTIDGFRFTDAATTGTSNVATIGAGGNFGGDASGVRIVDNVFAAPSRIAVYFNGPGGMNGATVEDNRVVGTSRTAECVGPAVAPASCAHTLFNLWQTNDVSFRRNVVVGAAGNGDRANVLALAFPNSAVSPTANNVVADNTIRNSCTFTCFSVNGGSDHITIRHNDVVVDTGNVVRFHTTWTGGTVQVDHNTFTSVGHAISFDSASADISGVTIARNAMTGAAIVSADTDQAVNAPCNWFGQAGGPLAVQISGTVATGASLASAELDGVCGTAAAVTGVAGDASVAVTWTAPTAPQVSPITSYTVTAAPGSASCTVAAPALGCTVVGLTNGTTYTFTVTASDGVSTGAPSAPSAPVTPLGVPSAPLTPAALAADALAIVSWTASATNGGSPITGYTVTASPGALSCTTTDALSCVVTGLTNGTPYTFRVTATNAVGVSLPSAATSAVTPVADTVITPAVLPDYTPVGPVRVFDTRAGESPNAIRNVAKAMVGGASILEVKVTDLAGFVPADGVGAVSINVTAVNATDSGFVTVYACGTRELVSSVNYATGVTVANAVIAPISATGTICFYAHTPVDLVTDLNGWFTADQAFTGVGPARVFDTRAGQSPNAIRTVAKSQIGGAKVLEVQITDLPGYVPAVGAGSVSLNVTVSNPALAGFLTVYPCGLRDEVSSVNYVAGQTVANAVITPVSPTGTVCFYSQRDVDVIVDVNGWLSAPSGYTAVTPKRVFDTRPGESAAAIRTVAKTKVGGADVLQVQLTDLAGVVPAAGVGAVSLNVTATNPQAAGFVTVYTCGTRELVSSVNYAAGQTVANAVLSPVSATGAICFYASQPTDLVVDVNGWFVAP